MLRVSDIGHGGHALSVSIVSLIAVGYVSLLAALTVLTHVAQLLSIPFITYATLCAIIAAVALALVVILAYRRWRDSQLRDYFNLATIILIGLLGVFLSVSMHRIGRISPDEYYGAASPVYYTQHPEARLGFASRLFYGPDEVSSAAFFTAGAYEYIQSAFAFLANARFATVYYLVAAGITGFLIPAAIFLAVYCFTGNVSGSILGAFVTMVGISLMGETSWAPGANSFLRAFEGKAFLQFVAVPLFIAVSLRYFAKPTVSAWLQLLAVCIASAGSSTTSFALVPLLGIVLCGSYFIAFRQNTTFGGKFILRVMFYFASFVYMGFWAVFVARYDGFQNAALLNADYPSTFSGYVAPFIYPAFPLTPVLIVLGIILAVILAPGKSRVLLIWWVGLAILLAINPLSAQILLRFFRGIYFRLLYVLPFPICWGFAASFVLERLRVFDAKPRLALAAGLWASAVILPVIIPVSIFRLPLYAWGNTLYSQDLVRAAEIVQVVPKGPMLAPYPLSGAISMFDSGRQQILARPDLLNYYLTRQGYEQDALLRAQVQLFFDEASQDTTSIDRLLQSYPEITSVVLKKEVYLRHETKLNRVFAANGLSRASVTIPGLLIFIK